MTSAESTPTTSEQPDVVQQIHIDAPPEAVFDYFVDREKLMRWMGVEATIDPQPGGEFKTNVDGENVAVGAYVEIDRPRRLRLTWGWQGSDVVPPGASLVTVDFELDGTGTRLTLTHSGLPDEEQCRSHREGWTHFLSVLGSAASGRDAD